MDNTPVVDERGNPMTSGEAIRQALQLRWLDPAIDYLGNGIGSTWSAIQNALNNPQHRWFSSADIVRNRLMNEPTIQPTPQNPAIPNVAVNR